MCKVSLYPNRAISLTDGEIQQLIDVNPHSNVISRFPIWIEIKNSSKKEAQSLIEKHITNLINDLEALNET